MTSKHCRTLSVHPLQASLYMRKDDQLSDKRCNVCLLHLIPEPISSSIAGHCNSISRKMGHSSEFVTSMKQPRLHQIIMQDWETIWKHQAHYSSRPSLIPFWSKKLLWSKSFPFRKQKENYLTRFLSLIFHHSRAKHSFVSGSIEPTCSNTFSRGESFRGRRRLISSKLLQLHKRSRPSSSSQQRKNTYSRWILRTKEKLFSITAVSTVSSFEAVL